MHSEQPHSYAAPRTRGSHVGGAPTDTPPVMHTRRAQRSNGSLAAWTPTATAASSSPSSWRRVRACRGCPRTRSSAPSSVQRTSTATASSTLARHGLSAERGEISAIALRPAMFDARARPVQDARRERRHAARAHRRLRAPQGAAQWEVDGVAADDAGARGALVRVTRGEGRLAGWRSASGEGYYGETRAYHTFTMVRRGGGRPAG
jgi:hypothetical protein